MPAFEFNEEYLSQIPAMQLLANLGYACLPPERALAERGGRLSNVLLEDILREQLGKINRIHFKGREHSFNDGNIQDAIQQIKNIRYVGLQKTNAEIHEMLTLGISLEQSIDGDSKSFTLNYVDWKNPANNVFHAVPEFSVERAHDAHGTHVTKTARPDIVLFVNGIPFVVIECKSPNIEVEQAVSQSIRNQDESYIPRIFTYAQTLLAVNKNEAKYATVGTPAKFWSVWDELEGPDEEMSACVNQPLSVENKDALFSGEFAQARGYFDKRENAVARLVTKQDECIYSLCRPERLLEMAYGFSVFEYGDRKIARYQQFFVVRAALRRIKSVDAQGKRNGGIVWHTQGSGKSITMVMLARALILDPELRNLRIILVTDRKDLDKQLGNTFSACGVDIKRATSGRDLAQHLQNRVGLITTIINKFDTALSTGKIIDDSPDIIALVDESHRTNFGELAARMRKMLPNACYIGFTGTPLLKTEKNSFARFGAIIEPSYPVRQAIADNAVVPLIYEGRLVEMEQNKRAIDLWFERHTKNLQKKQKADLKRKFSSARALSRADKVVYMCAFDISEHFRNHWQGRGGFKAQMVTPDKATALKYHKALEEIGMVSSEVVISPPDTREDHEEVGADPKSEVAKFWKRMMQKYGSEDAYSQNIINRFKESGDPEILIVVDRLITGFDAPRNTVLYLCRKLREHTLLQAIARVNRLYEGKEFGYIIDYANILGELNNALTTYDALSGYEAEDIADVLASIDEQASKLPQCHANLLDIFKEIKNTTDEEEYEILLADEELRDEFYACLTEYGNILAIALSSERFISRSKENEIKRYKDDFRSFQKLRASVKLRYADAVDSRKYNPRIAKLLDRYIEADSVALISESINIFDKKVSSDITKKRGIYKAKTTASRADTISHAVKRTITEKMESDPAFYEKFSTLIQSAIDDFRQQRISDTEYLDRAEDIRNQVANKKRDDVPDTLKGDDEACAYFGAVKSCLNTSDADKNQTSDVSVKTARAIKQTIEEEWKVDFWNDSSAQKSLKNALDDFFYDVVNKEENGVDLSPEQMNEITERALKIARFWRPS